MSQRHIISILLLLLKSVRTTTTLYYWVSARFGKWDRRWLRSPNAEAHTLLQWGHCGPVLGFMDAARRLARRFSKALIQLLSLSSPSSQTALHSSLSAAAASRSDDMSPIRGPSFAAIKQHRNTNSLVDSQLGGYSKVVVDEDSVQQSAEGRGGSFDTVLNFTVQAAVISQNTA